MPFALPFIAGASKDLDLERLVSKNGGLFAIGFFKLLGGRKSNRILKNNGRKRTSISEVGE